MKHLKECFIKDTNRCEVRKKLGCVSFFQPSTVLSVWISDETLPHMHV